LEIVSGKGFVSQIERTSIRHSYIIDARTPITIKENTLYFPGWTLKSNNKNIDIYPGYRGIIFSKLPPGKQKVELIYSDMSLYAISKTISLFSFLSILSIIILYYFLLFIKPSTLKIIKFGVSKTLE